MAGWQREAEARIAVGYIQTSGREWLVIGWMTVDCKSKPGVGYPRRWVGESQLPQTSPVGQSMSQR